MLAIFILVSAFGCSFNNPETPGPSEQQARQQAEAPSTAPLPLPVQMKVHFIDVGQADSIFVELPDGRNMLVDAGNNADDKDIVKYLKSFGVKKIDYLIGTHPHEDHIGGLDTVINSFDIGQFFMPRVTTTTQTFKDVLEAAQEKGLKITPAKAGVQIVQQDKLRATMLAPIKTNYENMNDNSAVIKITFGKVSFLLTGDIGKQPEAEMLLSSVESPTADVLKVAHHGSRYSSSAGFLKAVNPKYAVICAGSGNDYGHPHKETLKRLKGIKLYRTDLNGTVVFTTDGDKIWVETGH